MRNSHLNLISLVLLFILSCSVFAAKDTKTNRYSILDNISIDIEDDTILLTNRDHRGDYVEITHSYQLYINGYEIDMSRSQRKLVAKYYNQFFDIIDFAKDLGHDGARVGVVGAKIGVKSAAKALKAIFSEYEIDDLEEELEIESEKLESLIQELEERTEELEEMADEFEELHYELRSEVDELYELRWF